MLTSKLSTSFFLAVMVVSGFLVGVGKAEAVTFEVVWGYEYFVYTANTDKSVYFAGETIIVAESAMSSLTCGNYYGLSGYRITTTLLSQTHLTSGSVVASTNVPIYTAFTLVAPSTPGDYYIDVEGCSAASGECGTAQIPITVTAANTPPTATITLPTSNITLNQYAATTMTGTGSDPDTGDSITAYEWRESSCTAGTLLSTLSSFSLANPVAGIRNIFLRVQDSRGTWSTNCPSRQITVSTCVSTAGNSCTSPANACGTTNTGTTQCDSSCSATIAPPNPATYGQPCTSSANICGQTSTGTFGCSSICSVSTPPASACPAPTCGNGICEAWGVTPETPITCPSDCKVKVKQF